MNVEYCADTTYLCLYSVLEAVRTPPCLWLLVLGGVFFLKTVYPIALICFSACLGTWNTLF